MFSPVYRAAASSWRPPDIRQPWEWCEQHVEVDNTSPMPGKWRSANSPWVKEVMEVAADKRVRMIAIKCSAQSSKTQTILNLLCHDIAENPGPEMYVLANKEDCEDFVRDRFSPTVQNCAPVKDLLLRETKLNFTFRTMPLYFVGAGSMAKLQGKPIKKLKLDEVRNWPPGALETVLKRVRAFGELSQVMMISTAGKVGDPVDREYKKGDQRTPHFPCPHCGHIQQLRFTQLKWDTNEETKPGGKWHFDKLALTIRYECESCAKPITDNPTSRKMICRTARFVRMNPNAPAHHVSFQWNALLPWWVSWRSIVEEFIAARAALRAGDIEPYKTFVNETLGESWEDRLGVIDDFGFLEARKDDYELGEVWGEEIIRFMAADKQEAGGEHYWWVIRAFALNGKSRLVAYGKATSKQELTHTAELHKVKPGNCIIDSGYMAQDVYRFCVSSGWKAFKGDDSDFYVVPLKSRNPRAPAKMVRRFWRKTEAAVYNEQTKMKVANIPLFTFCNDPAKDLLAEYMTGMVGNWSIAKQVSKEYLQQITAERREEKEDSRGHIVHFWKQVRRDNHFGDCEIMIQVAAAITKTIARK